MGVLVAPAEGLDLDVLATGPAAREAGVPTRFIELAGQINSYMPQHVVHKAAQALNEHEKSVKGSKVLVLGVAGCGSAAVGGVSSILCGRWSDRVGRRRLMLGGMGLYAVAGTSAV